MIRLLPGVLGSDESSEEESYSIFENDQQLVEYPHYTRPAEFNGLSVPKVLVNGNHKEIREWRLQQSRVRSNKQK